ncbi:MAG: transcriptional regulator [Actinomycetota bacterium]
MDREYASSVGERLRSIRLRKGLSLHEVERRSAKEFKASVLGAYERGERVISVPRLQGLARFYGAPIEHLLPPTGERAPDVSAAAPTSACIDLAGLERSTTSDASMISRYLAMIQTVRGDLGARVITVRAEDVRVLAAALDETPGEFIARLARLGVRAGVGA